MSDSGMSDSGIQVQDAPRKARGKGHGLSKLPEHLIWCGIKRRCYNPKSHSFPWYGGRGIGMSPVWREDFAAFFRDVGPRPSKQHSLDRINTNGNYELGNVRWATAVEQANNKGPRLPGFISYQRAASKTAIYPGKGSFTGAIYCALGLAGEAGEFADKIKKVMRDGNCDLTADQRKKLIDELGDVCWYVAQLATELGVQLHYVATRNIEKLASRQERGTLHGDGDNR
ncbi:MazG nucleotide pyrophosphohydrolase domain protein [uncultured archaeon]|nr:MazG nucleotide pyrophosphohydrolase domain protein [uncultured archaeon]